MRSRPDRDGPGRAVSRGVNIEHFSGSETTALFRRLSSLAKSSRREFDLSQGESRSNILNDMFYGFELFKEAVEQLENLCILVDLATNLN